MPMIYVPPAEKGEKTKRVRFWITSSRGTNEFEIVRLPKNYTDRDMKAELESWCEQFGAWHHGDNIVRYGFEMIKGRPPKEKTRDS